jgi:hypothetical protein
MLKNDHRRVESVFRDYESASAAEKATLARQICKELIIHTKLEEEIFYPTCRDAGVEDDALDEAQVEHDGAKLLIADLMREDPDHAYRDAKVRVLSAYVKHHVGEEEKPRTGIFAKAKKAGVDMNGLGQRLAARKRELLGQAEDEGVNPPKPRSLHLEMKSDNVEENETMNRQSNYRERDEQGRFMSDDDERGSYRGRSSRYDRDDDDDGRRRSARGRERDEQGRFMSEDDDRSNGGRSSRGRGHGGWFGDPEGHSEAAERGWEERGSRRMSRDDDDYRSRSSARGGSYRRSRDDDDDYRRSSHDRGQGGWFGDSEGHSEASRRGWRNPDHRESGWFGDSEGHSQASRRGWQNPDHGESGWFGDSEGHSQASRRGWQNPDHGESGWYGDPEGHSEASHRGWESRGGSRGSRRMSRDNDDDDRRGSRSGGSRGWHGDSRGHSEAARRGWQDRD